MSKRVSNNFDVVRYNNIEYDVRYCCHPHEDNVAITIGTEEFEEALVDDSGDWTSKKAVDIDLGIYCYVPGEVLKTYSDEEFQKYVNENFD